MEVVVKKPEGSLRMPLALSVISVTIAVIALLVAVFAYKHSHTQVTDLSDRLTSSLKSITELQKQQQQMLAQQSQSLADYQSNLQKVITRSGSNLDALAVFDAVFLTKEANDQLHYEHNVSAAIQLLTAAKNRLNELHHANTHKAVEAIASDIGVLQTVEKVDVESIYLTLSKALSIVPYLPTAASPSEAHRMANEAAETSEKTTADNPPSWSQSIKNSWQELKKLVSVQHSSATMPSVLTYRQSVFLYENVSALISQTQYAVLHGNNAIFQANLKQLILWLTDYFVVTDPQVSEMLLTFKQLQSVNVQPVIPGIPSSLRAIAALQAKAVEEE